MMLLPSSRYGARTPFSVRPLQRLQQQTSKLKSDVVRRLAVAEKKKGEAKFRREIMYTWKEGTRILEQNDQQQQQQRLKKQQQQQQQAKR